MMSRRLPPGSQPEGWWTIIRLLGRRKAVCLCPADRQQERTPYRGRLPDHQPRPPPPWSTLRLDVNWHPLSLRSTGRGWINHAAGRVDATSEISLDGVVRLDRGAAAPTHQARTCRHWDRPETKIYPFPFREARYKKAIDVVGTLPRARLSDDHREPSVFSVKVRGDLALPFWPRVGCVWRRSFFPPRW